jgi:hypothetical protein
LIAEDSASIALSWPKTMRLQRRVSRLRSCSRHRRDRLGRDARDLRDAVLDSLRDRLLALASGNSIWDAPVSSITSIALSGSLRSWMYFADSSTAALIASGV